MEARKLPVLPPFHEITDSVPRSTTEQSTSKILQRLIAEQECSKSLLIANNALQATVGQNEGSLMAVRARCEDLESQVSFMQVMLLDLKAHLGCVTNCLLGQRDGDGNLVDTAALASQVWTFREHIVELRRINQVETQKGTSLESEITRLRQAESTKNNQILQLKNMNLAMQKRIEAFECKVKRLQAATH